MSILHVHLIFMLILSYSLFLGLQVQLANGTWFSVAPRPGSVIINLGEMLSEMTSWRAKATIHRVLDLGQVRYSVPFFFEPGYHARFPKVLPRIIKNMDGTTTLELEQDVEYITYGPWIRKLMKDLFLEFIDL